MKTIGIAAILGTALATTSISLGAGTATAAQQCGSVNGWSQVSAAGSASCPFALNVANTVGTLSLYGANRWATVNAYSPVTGLNYAVSCERLSQFNVECQGGNNAIINLVETNPGLGIAN